MIESIGKKRIAFVALFAVITGTLAAGYYLYFLPQQEKLESELRTTRSQVSAKRGDIQRLSEEYKQIQEQKAYFQNLEDAGYLFDQSRAVASRRIEDAQKFSRILSARYTIEPAKILQQEDAEKAGYVILSSPISIELEALDDMDIYNFVFWLQNSLPGQVAVTGLDLEKKQNITESRIRAIGSGNPIVMVSGNLALDWRTIVSSEDIGQDMVAR